MFNRHVKGKLPDQGKPTTNATRGSNKPGKGQESAAKGWWLCYKILSSLWAVKTVWQIISDIILFPKGVIDIV